MIEATAQNNAPGTRWRCALPVSEDPGSPTMDFSPILLTFQQKKEVLFLQLWARGKLYHGFGANGLEKSLKANIPS